MVMLFAGIAVSLSMTFLFNVKDIEITGESRYSYADIATASGVMIGDNLYRTDMKKVRESITTKLAYIENVKIRRKLPFTLTIEVTPCVPAANIEYTGGYIVASTNGKILDITSQAVKGLPSVKGIVPVQAELSGQITTQDPQKQEIFTDLCGEIIRLDFKGIAEIDITDKYEITMNYADRIRIEFGNRSESSYKLAYIKKIIEENIDPAQKGYIMVRGNNGISFIDEKDMVRYYKTVERKRAESESAAISQSLASESESLRIAQESVLASQSEALASNSEALAAIGGGN
jgi:cell division protein FtsQ